MKTLYPKQQEICGFFLKAHAEGADTLDTSEVGTGKTIVACELARQLGRPVAVLCPKAVIPSWERELKEFGITPLFVLNYEKVRRGSTEWLTKRGKKAMTWHLPKGTLVLVDECHKCKAMYSQNAQLLINLKTQGFAVHAMSATAATDPTEMRALGYLLGEHNLNRAADGLKSFHGWMMHNGCSKDHWGQWAFTRAKEKSKEALKALHQRLYKDKAARLTTKDFPDSFKGNHVICEPVEFADQKKILKAYEDLGITPQVVEDFIENGTVEDSEYMLVNILRARQLAESLKLKDLLARAIEFNDEHNKAVVIFVNFVDSAEWLYTAAKEEGLHVGKVVGGQSTEERQRVVDSFQADELHLLIVNIQAGGTGLSLHDINGKRPRVSLICPTFNEKEFAQALGRIHRNGAKSDALQYILMAANSVEEAVVKAVMRKLANLDKLQNNN